MIMTEHVRFSSSSHPRLIYWVTLRYWTFWNFGRNFDAIEPVDNWAYLDNFTQLIWKSTKEFGIGVSGSFKGNLYIIGHFFPPGNQKNLFVKNVLAPKKFVLLMLSF